MILARCFSTVRVLKSKSEAISFDERPAATNRATSNSRAESAEGEAPLAGGRLPAAGPVSAATWDAKNMPPAMTVSTAWIT